MNKPAAIYARVSSDRQKEDHTIASQTTALVEYAKTNGYVVPSEWVFQDEGYSGASLQRPGLEALRDLAQGQMTTVLIYSPDRLSRKYAYQVLLAEEFARCGVEIVFLKSPSGGSPEDQLVVQTDAPGFKVCSTIRHFSPTGHRRLCGSLLTTARSEMSIYSPSGHLRKCPQRAIFHTNPHFVQMY